MLNYAFVWMLRRNWASMDNENAQQNVLLSCLFLTVGGVSCSGVLEAIPFLLLSAIYSTSRYCLLGREKRSAECSFYGVQRAAPFGRCVVVYNNYHPAPKNPLKTGQNFGYGNV